MTDLVAANLSDLAVRINDEHRLCEAALRTSLEHAVTAGDLLVQAKAALPHGAWGDWLRQNFAGSARTAQTYMRLSRELPALVETNPQRVADLSLRDAVALVATPRGTPGALSDDAPEAAFSAEIDQQLAGQTAEVAVLHERLARLDARQASGQCDPATLIAQYAALSDHAEGLQGRAAETTLRIKRRMGQILGGSTSAFRARDAPSDGLARAESRLQKALDDVHALALELGGEPGREMLRTFYEDWIPACIAAIQDGRPMPDASLYLRRDIILGETSPLRRLT
jgi:hypothetical protein